MDEKWNLIVEFVKGAAEESIGYAKKKREQWISDGSWKLMQERKEIKIQLDSCDSNVTPHYEDQLKAQYKQITKM